MKEKVRTNISRALLVAAYVGLIALYLVLIGALARVVLS